MKVWITKYALTAGISEKDGRVCGTSSEMIDCGRGAYFHKPHWHTDRASAIARAETMRLRKIDSLKKSLRAFEQMEFK